MISVVVVVIVVVVIVVFVVVVVIVDLISTHGGLQIPIYEHVLHAFSNHLSDEILLDKYNTQTA